MAQAYTHLCKPVQPIHTCAFVDSQMATYLFRLREKTLRAVSTHTQV
jgi:hypothetical protein